MHRTLGVVGWMRGRMVLRVQIGSGCGSMWRMVIGVVRLVVSELIVGAVWRIVGDEVERWWRHRYHRRHQVRHRHVNDLRSRLLVAVGRRRWGGRWSWAGRCSLRRRRRQKRFPKRLHRTRSVLKRVFASDDAWRQQDQHRNTDRRTCHLQNTHFSDQVIRASEAGEMKRNLNEAQLKANKLLFINNKVVCRSINRSNLNRKQICWLL